MCSSRGCEARHAVPTVRCMNARERNAALQCRIAAPCSRVVTCTDAARGPCSSRSCSPRSRLRRSHRTRMRAALRSIRICADRSPRRQAARRRFRCTHKTVRTLQTVAAIARGAAAASRLRRRLRRGLHSIDLQNSWSPRSRSRPAITSFFRPLHAVRPFLSER